MKRLLPLLLFVLITSGARAADVTGVAAGLKAGSFKQKAGVVAELAGLGDPKGIPLLEALQKGQLYFRKTDGRLVVTEKAGKGYRLTDPFTGEVLGGVQRPSVKKIRVNNQMRGGIKAALSQLELLSALYSAASIAAPSPPLPGTAAPAASPAARRSPAAPMPPPAAIASPIPPVSHPLGPPLSCSAPLHSSTIPCPPLPLFLRGHLSFAQKGTLPLCANSNVKTFVIGSWLC